MTKRFAVDRADAVGDLDHAGTPIGLPELLHCRGVVIVVHIDEEGLPLVHGEKDLLVVAPGIFFWLNVDESELAAIRAYGEIVHRHHVRVNPSRTR